MKEICIRIKVTNASFRPLLLLYYTYVNSISVLYNKVWKYIHKIETNTVKLVIANKKYGNDKVIDFDDRSVINNYYWHSLVFITQASIY